MTEIKKSRFKTSMLRLSLCDYSESYILVKGTITVAPATAAAPNNATKMVIFKDCASLILFFYIKHLQVKHKKYSHQVYI